VVVAATDIQVMTMREHPAVKGSSTGDGAAERTDDAMHLTADVRRFVHETPGVGGGFPQVRNSRTPVRCIVLTYRATNSFDQTAERYAYLPREDVRGALDYYAAYPERVDEDIAREERAWAEHQGR
jgi:uncharacterized protein (DUF433 family)